MPTIAILGAGPGLGLSIANVFGRHGFSVALISRTHEKLDGLAAELGESGIDAAGFAADVMDRPSIADAFARLRERFGGVDVLEYSPAPHNPVPGITMTGPLEATDENIHPQLEYYLYGGIAAAQQVLPEMIERDSGTLLFTTGGSSSDPLAGPPEMATVAVGSAALRAWVLKLHQATAGSGVYAAHIPISRGSAPADRNPSRHHRGTLLGHLHQSGRRRAPIRRLLTHDASLARGCLSGPALSPLAAFAPIPLRSSALAGPLSPETAYSHQPEQENAMQRRYLGATGISVSDAALGTMNFGGWGNADRAETIGMIHHAIDASINFIDTADVYQDGETEDIVGEALEGRRDEVVLATKFGIPSASDLNHQGASPRWIRRAVEASLRRLRTDHIDLYQLHRYCTVSEMM